MIALFLSSKLAATSCADQWNFGADLVQVPSYSFCTCILVSIRLWTIKWTAMHGFGHVKMLFSIFVHELLRAALAVELYGFQCVSHKPIYVLSGHKLLLAGWTVYGVAALTNQ